MTNNLSPQAKANLESARRADGTFGTQVKTEPTSGLGGHFPPEDVETAQRSYEFSLLASSYDYTEDGLSETLDGFELSPEAKASCAEQVADFMTTHAHLLHRAAEVNPAYDLDQAGHDFAMTRNGHGTGFWDRGLGDVGDELTEACKTYGSAEPYVGDDGLVYLM